MKSHMQMTGGQLDEPTVTEVWRNEGPFLSASPFVTVRFGDVAFVNVESPEEGDRIAAAFTEAAAKLREAEQAVTA